MVATGQINFIPKTQVMVPVYDKMASIKCLIVKIYQKLRFLTFEKKFSENKRNSTIAKYRVHCRFLLRGQNILASVIRT